MSLEFINPSNSENYPVIDSEIPKTEPNEPEPFTPDQERLLNMCLPMVRSFALRVARYYFVKPGSPEFEEMMGDGYEGLVMAIRKYDYAKLPENTVTGTSYIGASILGEIRHGLRDRWGRYYEKVEVDGKIKRKDGVARLKPSVILGTANSLGEQERDPDIKTEEIERLEVAPQHARMGETSAEEIGFNAELMGILKTYSPFDQEIFIRRIFGDESQAAIASAMDTSQVNVSRHLKRMYADLATRMKLESSQKAA